MARIDTTLESTGAEFLVLGHLLIERIAAHKAYTNTQGYDLIAVNPEVGTAARIQVKSRWQTGSSGFFIENFDADFVVYCRLNRGSRDGRAPKKEPEFYVFPVAVLTNSAQPAGKVRLRHVPQAHEYQGRWDLIRDFLASRSS